MSCGGVVRLLAGPLRSGAIEELSAPRNDGGGGVETKNVASSLALLSVYGWVDIMWRGPDREDKLFGRFYETNLMERMLL
jgi:hypothetical protein